MYTPTAESRFAETAYIDYNTGMNPGEFRSVLEHLEARIHSFNAARVSNAYRDLQNTSVLLDQIEADLAAMEQRLTPEDVGYGEQEGRRLQTAFMAVTLLKALYLFSNILVEILLAETLQTKKETFQGFLSSKKARSGPLASIHLPDLLPAYCVVILRHKLIAHHDFQRTHGIAYAQDGIRFNPYPRDWQLFSDQADKAQRLQRIYELRIPGIQGLTNIRRLVDQLFYGIPIGSLGDINPDRRVINEMIDHLGCTSKSRREVEQAIDRFCGAIVDAVP